MYRCARRAIKLARLYPLVGYAYVVNQSEYRRILQDEGFDCDPYSFLVWTAFIHVNKWVQQHRSDHKISLFFEAGYETQPRANELLKASMSHHLPGTINRVSSYAFVKKEDSEAAQAGDLIAWHVRRGYEHMRVKKPFRPDTAALIEDKSIRTVEYTEDMLKDVRRQFLKAVPNLQEAARIIFSRPSALEPSA